MGRRRSVALREVAGVYHVASRLASEGFNATVARDSDAGADVLAALPGSTATAALKVRTTECPPGFGEGAEGEADVCEWGMGEGGGGGSRRFDPRSVARGRVGLSKVCVQAVWKALPYRPGPGGHETCSSATRAFKAALKCLGRWGGCDRAENVLAKHRKVPPASPATFRSRR